MSVVLRVVTLSDTIDIGAFIRKAIDALRHTTFLSAFLFHLPNGVRVYLKKVLLITTEK